MSSSSSAVVLHRLAPLCSSFVLCRRATPSPYEEQSGVTMRSMSPLLSSRTGIGNQPLSSDLLIFFFPFPLWRRRSLWPFSVIFFCPSVSLTSPVVLYGQSPSSPSDIYHYHFRLRRRIFWYRPLSPPTATALFQQHLKFPSDISLCHSPMK